MFYLHIVALMVTGLTANEMSSFFFIIIAEFERAAKIRKIAVYRFLISLLVPEL